IKKILQQNTRVYFIDDGLDVSFINNYPVISYKKFIGLNAAVKKVCIAVADSTIREKLTDKCISDNLEIINVTAENVTILDEVELGTGSILCPFVTLTSNIKIGKSFHANLYSYVGHDCVIGDFVTFAPSVKCNGNVIIEDYAYLGTGAIIKQGTPERPRIIGKGAVVGMGAIVTKNVAAGDVVVGNPAKSIKK
ncbi:MAG: hypothetical protein QM500_10625, partial [Methylococcales bacterium]